jgi:hypothetical protein
MASISANGGRKWAVRFVPSEDGGFLLDIERDRIFKLNRAGTEVWHLLCQGHQGEEIADIISRKYEIEYSRAAADAAPMLAHLAEMRLSPEQALLDAEQPTSKAAPDKQPFYPWYGQTAGDTHPAKTRFPAVVVALLGLAVFDLVLSLSSLKALCTCVAAWPLRRAKNPGSEITGQICCSVQRACVWYPKRALCLQRSAVTACLLKSYGLPAQMVVGIRDMPFMAHAWVEVNDAVVNDWPGVRKFYRPVVAH